MCVDESLMLWKGRLGFRQYMPKKRSRFGVKSYELCESDTGYVWDFLVYTGATTGIEEEGGQGEKVVLTLMERLLVKNYKLYSGVEIRYIVIAQHKCFSPNASDVS